MAAQTVHTPLLLTKGPQYDAAFNKSQKIMVYTSNDDDDYSMMLPVDMGKAGQYLHTDGSLNMYWDEMFIKMMTTAQRITFGVASITPTGTMVYDTTTAQTYLWNGTSWTSISGSAVDATFFIYDNVTPTKAIRFEVSPVSAGATRVITAANRDLNLDTPIFSNVGLINGANTFTISAGAMAGPITLTMPTTSGSTNQFAQLSAPGVLSWGDGLADGQFYIFNTADATRRIDFDASSITAANTRTIIMADRDVNLAAPSFDSMTVLDVGSAFGVTLSSPALTANYTITMPTRSLNLNTPIFNDITTSETVDLVAGGGAVADGYAADLELTPLYSTADASTLTRHNYINVRDITAGVVPTDGAVFRFETGTAHVALEAGTTPASLATTSAWIKINIAGTIHYIPVYASTA